MRCQSVNSSLDPLFLPVEGLLSTGTDESVIVPKNEKKHREILNDMKKNYVELNAYKESQTHIYSELEKVSTGIEDLKNYLMGKGTNHDR